MNKKIQIEENLCGKDRYFAWASGDELKLWKHVMHDMFSMGF